MKSGPAQTRHSLFASATSAPRRTASIVGARPAAPTIADMTQSEGRAAASLSAEGPAPTSMFKPASASRAAVRLPGSATAAKRGFRRRHASTSASRLRPAVTASTGMSAPCSRSSSITCIVDWPTEPVTPRIETVRPTCVIGPRQKAATSHAGQTPARRQQGATPPSNYRCDPTRRRAQESDGSRLSRRSAASRRIRTSHP